MFRKLVNSQRREEIHIAPRGKLQMPGLYSEEAIWNRQKMTTFACFHTHTQSTDEAELLLSTNQNVFSH